MALTKHLGYFYLRYLPPSIVQIHVCTGLAEVGDPSYDRESHQKLYRGNIFSLSNYPKLRVFCLGMSLYRSVVSNDRCLRTRSLKNIKNGKESN